MTLTEEILTILTSYHKGYRLLRMRMHGINPQLLPDLKPKLQNASNNTLRVTLSRLKQKGLVENTNGTWKITEKGRGRLATLRRTLFPKHSPTASRTKKLKNLIIAFDIPESHRHKRRWLRIELVNLGFELLQESVWFGPAPLPAQFINSLQELRILSHIKFFEAKEADVI